MKSDSEATAHRLENAIALTLTLGVGIAVAVVLTGIIITLSSEPALWHLESAGYVQSLHPVPLRPALLLHELRTAPGIAAMTAGLFLVICTPLARLAVSTIMLVHTREYRFLPLTGFVLLLIAASVVLGIHPAH